MNRVKCGCEYCQNFWIKYPRKKPYPLVDDIKKQIILYQCKECETYWEEDLRTARCISYYEAQQDFSDYFQERGGL